MDKAEALDYVNLSDFNADWLFVLERTVGEVSFNRQVGDGGVELIYFNVSEGELMLMSNGDYEDMFEERVKLDFETLIHEDKRNLWGLV